MDPTHVQICTNQDLPCVGLYRFNEELELAINRFVNFALCSTTRRLRCLFRCSVFLLTYWC